MNKFSCSPKLTYPSFSPYVMTNNFCPFDFLNISWLLLLFFTYFNSLSSSPVISSLDFNLCSFKCMPRPEWTKIQVYRENPSVPPYCQQDKAPGLHRACQPLRSPSWCASSISQLLAFAYAHTLCLLQRRLVFIEDQRVKINYQQKVRGRIWRLQATVLTQRSAILRLGAILSRLLLSPSCHVPDTHQIISVWN